MRVEDYFAQLREDIAACLWVQTTTLSFDERGTHQGYVRGELRFVDGSTLHIREYVDTETTAERLIYAYQYMDAAQKLIFRYDNSGHHRRLNLPTFPHHKHDGSENAVIASPPPDLATVLAEISALIDLSAY